MGSTPTTTGSSKLAASLFLLLTVCGVSMLFFIWAGPSDQPVPEVELSQPNGKSGRASFASRIKDQTRSNPSARHRVYRVIRQKPDFSVADAEDEITRQREHKINQTIRQARQHLDQKDYAQAINILTALLEEHPDNYSGWMELGIAHLFNDFDLEAARVAFVKAIEIEPNNRSSLEAIKNVYLALNDRPGGINLLRHLAEKYPDAPLIASTLAQLTPH